MMTVADLERQRRDDLRAKIADDTYVDGAGAVRWNMGNVVPPCVFNDADLEVPEGHQEAYDAHLTEFLSDYRKSQANVSDEDRAERAFEMRAAFGEGEEVVNVITGERFRT